MSGWRSVDEVARVFNAAAARERFEARRADSSPAEGETE